MRLKVLTLALICLFLFTYCKSPADPKIEETLSLRIESFLATPDSIMRGETAVLYWATQNAVHVEIDQGIGRVEQVGRIEVQPEETTVYTLTAENWTDQISQSCEVTVDQNPDIAWVTPIEENCYEKPSLVLYEGTIENIGTKTAYDVEFRVSLYHAENQIGSTLAIGYVGPMEPGVTRRWDFRWQTDFSCYELELKYDITWEE